MGKPIKKKKPGKKDLREARFPYEYVIDLNGQKAAERCGVAPRGARVWASRLLTNTNIKAKIKELQEDAQKRAIKTADDWEREVDVIAFFRGHADFYKEDGTLKDIKDLTPEQLAVVHEIENTTVGGGDKPLVRVTNLKLYDKLKALDMKGKRLGVYKMTLEVKDPYMKYLEAIRRQKQEKAG